MPTEEEKVLELQSKQLVLRFIDELWNKRNLDIVDELCHPEYFGEIAGVPDGVVRSREALKQLIATYHAAFEVNATFRPVFIIAEDLGQGAVMMVVYRDYLLRHKGEFQGIPPTGKEVRIRSINMYAILHGPKDQIIHHVVQFDTRSLRQQLRGAIPTPG